SESFHATAMGPTPTGQQATLVVSQTAVLSRTPNLIRDFGFTAEVIDIKPHGNSSANGIPQATGTPSTLAAAPSTHAKAPPSARALDAAFASSLEDPLAWDMG